MKTLSILLILILRITIVFADNNATISNVYINRAEKKNLYVLQLKNDNAYDYMRYTDKRIYHDFGVFTIQHGKISFQSRNRKHGFNSVGGKEFFLTKKGLFKTRIDSWTGQHSTLNISNDAMYMKSWDFNPITGKTPTDIDTEKLEIAAENKNKKMIALTKKYFLTTTAFYTPEYKSLLLKSYCGPGYYKTNIGGIDVPWNMDTSRTVLVNDFNTVIHESTHTFNGNSYLIIPGIEIPVYKTSFYKTCEFKVIVPADAKSKIFRYNVYVDENSIVSSNVHGIYGLMDEFSAYENGTRACVIAAKNSLANGDTVLARNFLLQAQATYFAYYEFNLFIAWYLHHSKVSQPDIFKETMNNTNLRVTYTMIDQEFSATIADFKKTITAAKAGKDFLNYNEKQYVVYTKELLTKEQSYLAEYAVKGVTVENYFRFLTVKK